MRPKYTYPIGYLSNKMQDDSLLLPAPVALRELHYRAAEEGKSALRMSRMGICSLTMCDRYCWALGWTLFDLP